jgi:hypothetical protein
MVQGVGVIQNAIYSAEVSHVKATIGRKAHII